MHTVYININMPSNWKYVHNKPTLYRQVHVINICCIIRQIYVHIQRYIFMQVQQTIYALYSTVKYVVVLRNRHKSKHLESGPENSIYCWLPWDYPCMQIYSNCTV